MTTTYPERSWTHEDRAEQHGLTTPGPWDAEPDKVQWVDEATGLDCLAVRNRMGAWCGYVGVPPEHPAHGLSYGTGLVEDVWVHGGLTFADRCDEDAKDGHGVCHVPYEGRPADVWWFGFDCAHAGDLCPHTLRYKDALPFVERDVYRPLAYVKAEVARLAEQLAGLAG